MILIGTIGFDNVYLEREHLETHLHCIGTSQKGKSRLIEHICNEFFKEGKGFMLIDPLGKLYRRVIRNMAMQSPYRQDEVTLFDASAQNPHGFNPFHFEGSKKEIWTRATLMMTLTLQAWGFHDPDERPLFKNWVFTLYYTIMEQKITLAEGLKLFYYGAQIPHGEMYDEWEELHAQSRAKFRDEVQKLRARFQGFRHPHFQEILERETLNLDRIIEKRGVLLANLRESNLLDTEQNKTLASLFIGYIWNYILTRNTKTEFYIIVDEFQMFATERVKIIMDQAANLGLHLMVFHQREEHMSKSLLEAMENATAKIIFTGKREFTLNGVEIVSPYVDDFENNETIDKLEQEYVLALAPPTPSKPEAIIEATPVDKVVESEEYDVPDMKPDRPTDVEGIVKELKYAKPSQVARIRGDDSPKSRLTNKKLLSLFQEKKLARDESNIPYVYMPLDVQPSSFMQHELLITELHIQLWDSIVLWEQRKLKDGDIHPDAFYLTTYGAFYLELENSRPRAQSIEDKVKGYIEHAKNDGHRTRCDQFRVHFRLASEEKARNLCQKLLKMTLIVDGQKEKIKHKGKFWASFDNTAIDLNGVTYDLTTGLPTTMTT